MRPPARTRVGPLRSPVSDGDRDLGGISGSGCTAFDKQLLLALGTDGDVDARESERRRSSRQRAATIVEVLEQNAGRISVTTVAAVGAAEGLNPSALRNAQRIASTVTQIPPAVRSAIQ